MKIEITVLISTVTALAGMLIGIAGAGRTHRLDIEKRSRETATIISEIGYVKSGIDDIKHIYIIVGTVNSFFSYLSFIRIKPLGKVFSDIPGNGRFFDTLSQCSSVIFEGVLILFKAIFICQINK